MNKIALSFFFCLVAVPAVAQMMPAPRSAPHTPVNREAVVEHHAPPRDVQGQALVVDGDRLRVGETDVRLFGIVAPQLSANSGPQARAALDELVGGGQAIACHIRDRDHEGHLLAACRSASGVDPALELLRRGLAVAARSTLAETELAASYQAAESAAQNEKLGVWLQATPAPVAAPTPVAVVPKAEPTPVVVAVKAPEAPAVPAVVAKAAVDVPAKTVPPVIQEEADLFARYQILLFGAVLLVTALLVMAFTGLYRAREKRDEMKALAAALRGELLAARAVCLTRVRNIANAEDDKAAQWPRIRSTLYQAYVSKLGWLGAELARQVASIYGQASDYAAYYNNVNDSNAAPVGTPKRQALQSLATHIEEVLPRLAGIEQTGQRAASPVYSPMPAMPAALVLAEPVVPMIAITSTHVPAPAQPSQPVQEVQEIQVNLEGKLRGMVRHLREKFVDPEGTDDEAMRDYTSMIEEDAEQYSLSGTDEETHAPFGRVIHS